MKKQKIYFFLCIAALFLSGISCNSTEDDVISYTVSESVRVSGFSLAANDSVLAHLDTIFFTIDLNKGQIYNADSLPVGTDVSSLIANISFDNVAQAKIYMDKGDPAKNDTIDYIANPTDSIGIPCSAFGLYRVAVRQRSMRKKPFIIKGKFNLS